MGLREILVLTSLSLSIMYVLLEIPIVLTNTTYAYAILSKLAASPTHEPKCIITNLIQHHCIKTHWNHSFDHVLFIVNICVSHCIQMWLTFANYYDAVSAFAGKYWVSNQWVSFLNFMSNILSGTKLYQCQHLKL